MCRFDFFNYFYYTNSSNLTRTNLEIKRWNMYKTFPFNSDDEGKRRHAQEADCLSIPRDALAVARRSSKKFDVHMYIAIVFFYAARIPHCLRKLKTSKHELWGLEQEGYESAARMHLDFARSEMPQKITIRSVSAFYFYAQLSERPPSFFKTDADELKQLSK